MSFFRMHRPSAYLYAAALAGLFATAAATQVADFDIWWHLATGWVIGKLHILPRYDLFSYTAFGQPWINPEWLFQLVQWALYYHTGLVGLMVLKILLAIVVVVCVFVTVERLTASRNTALWATVFFLWGAAYRLTDRPFLLGMALLALFCLILHRHCLFEPTRWIWALPILQLLWINCHGGGLIGPQIVVLVALGESLQHLASRFGGPEPIARRRIEHLWIVALLCLAACLVNPWGADLFVLALQGLQMKAILNYTQEWLPILHPSLDPIIPPQLYFATLVLSLVSFILNAPRARISHLLLLGLMASLIVKGHRFGPEFLVVLLPITLMNFKQCLPQRPFSSLSGPLATWIQLGLVLCISTWTTLHGIPVRWDGQTYNVFGIGVHPFAAPEKLADFLVDNEIHGRMYNDMGMGGYLIYRLWPKELVFIDGRTPIFGDAFYKDVVDTTQGYANFDDLAKRFQFDYLIFNSFDAWNRRWLHQHLWESKEWKLVFADFDGIIYVKNVPKFREVIERFELPQHPIVEEMKKANPEVLKQLKASSPM